MNARFSNFVAFGEKKLLVIVFMLKQLFVFEKRATNFIRRYKIAYFYVKIVRWILTTNFTKIPFIKKVYLKYKEATRLEVYQTNTLQLSESVVAIGAFDGVHRGHQAVIQEMIHKSQLKKVPSVVYTFDPPPRAYFQGAQVLTKREKKIQLMERLGVDYLVIADFNEGYLERVANDFIEELSELTPKQIVVGDDFRFGHNRSGDLTLLKKHFPVEPLRLICNQDGEKISSTRIRQLLIEGKRRQAVSLLGWT